MPELPVSLLKGDKIDPRTEYGDRLAINMYAVKKQILGAEGYMQCYPGLSSFGTATDVDRAGIYNERFGDHYRLSGDELLSINELGVRTVLGTLVGITTLTQATMKDFYSFQTQGLIADGKMYLYDPVGGFQQIIDLDLGVPIDGVWINGYYFLTDGEYIYHTDITDETAIDPLKYAGADFMPDPILGVAKTQDNKVAVFGRYTVEYFRDVANPQFAFSRLETRAQKIGIVATHAKCEVEGSYFIVGGRKDEAVAIHLLGTGASTKVSTKEIDQILEGYTEAEMSDIRVEARQTNDTTFVIFHLPNETVCYNLTIAKTNGIGAAWFILRSGLDVDIDYRAINGIYDSRINEWVYGDKNDSRLGTLDNTLFTQYDLSVQWELYTPLLKLEDMSIDEIEIETISGFNDYNDASVAISLTYDGLTYGLEWWEMYGAPAEYVKRFIIRRLGYVNNYVGLKLRGATKSRMAFGLAKVTYS